MHLHCSDVDFAESRLNWTNFYKKIFGCSLNPLKSAAFGYDGSFWRRRRVLNAALVVVLRSVRYSCFLYPIHAVRNNVPDPTGCARVPEDWKRGNSQFEFSASYQTTSAEASR